jgi:hypothetical protein
MNTHTGFVYHRRFHGFVSSSFFNVNGTHNSSAMCLVYWNRCKRPPLSEEASSSDYCWKVFVATSNWNALLNCRKVLFIPNFSLINRSLDSSLRVATRLHVGRPEFDSQQVLGIFLFATASRPALGHIQLPILWVTGDSFPGGKEAGACSWPLASI